MEISFIIGLPIVFLVILYWLKVPELKLFTISGIPFFVSKAFISFYLTIVLAAGIFSGLKDCRWVAFVLILSYSCVVLHEYAHAIVAQKLGYSAEKIIIYPFTGIAFLDIKEIKSHTHEFWISIAGPASNIFQAILVYPFIDYGNTFINRYFEINVILAAFNLLIPVYPMDGGRVIHSILSWKIKDEVRISLLTLVFSAIALVIVLPFLWLNDQIIAFFMICFMFLVPTIEYFSIKRTRENKLKIETYCEAVIKLCDLKKEMALLSSGIVRILILSQIDYISKSVEDIKKLVDKGEIDKAKRRVESVSRTIHEMDDEIEFLSSGKFRIVRGVDQDLSFACQKAVRKLNIEKFGVG